MFVLSDGSGFKFMFQGCLSGLSRAQERNETPTTWKIPGMEGSSPPLAVTYVVIEIVIVLGWAARAQPNREQSLFLVFHDKDVG